MYCRIVMQFDKVDGEWTNSEEVTHDCDAVRIRNIRPCEGSEDMVAVEISRQDQHSCLHLEFPKDRTQVYLMNNEGRTFDSYRWS